MDIRILVAAHKKYWMPHDKMYLPISVGHCRNPVDEFTGDDIGENISAKNPNYCELTAIYWAWKNLRVDYVGLVHYRRYFTVKNMVTRLLQGKQGCVLSSDEAEKLLALYDVVLPKKRHYHIETIRSHYEHSHNPKDLIETERILREKYPEYVSCYNDVLSRTSAHMFNMFIMKWPYFSDYCQWLFSILEELETKINITAYNNAEARVFGYLSELLMDVWIQKNCLQYKEVSVMFMENQHWPKKIGRFLKFKFSGGPFGHKTDSHK